MRNAVSKTLDMIIVLLYLTTIATIVVISGIVLFTYKYVLLPISAYVK